jgi:hypothetical protein
MHTTTVSSSNISAIGYNCEIEQLQVDFKSGTSYTYDNVPTRVFQDFLHSESKGKFLNNVIKNKYSFNKM